MTKLDDYLAAPAEDVLPPRVRWWKGRLAAGDRLAVEVRGRPDPLGGGGSDLVVRRHEQEKERAPEVDDWDDELNAALVALGVRAVDLGNEAERFALGLRAALRGVERRYGDGYLNAVLVDLVRGSDLGRYQPVADVLAAIRQYSPDRTGGNYNACRDAIASAIGSRAAELRDKLGYGPDEVTEVMPRAIARYLDGRFSVTARRKLGWQ